MKTWLITGCSTGLGKSLAKTVLKKGYQAVVTARNTDTLAEFEREFSKNALVLPLDVTDNKAISNTVKRAIEHFGSIDVLVNNAGYGYRAAVEEGEFEDLFTGKKIELKDVELAAHGFVWAVRRK